MYLHVIVESAEGSVGGKNNFPPHKLNQRRNFLPFKHKKSQNWQRELALADSTTTTRAWLEPIKLSSVTFNHPASFGSMPFSRFLTSLLCHFPVTKISIFCLSRVPLLLVDLFHSSVNWIVISTSHSKWDRRLSNAACARFTCTISSLDLCERSHTIVLRHTRCWAVSGEMVCATHRRKQKHKKLKFLIYFSLCRPLHFDCSSCTRAIHPSVLWQQ